MLSQYVRLIAHGNTGPLSKIFHKDADPSKLLTPSGLTPEQFSAAVSTLMFSGVNKTTSPNRHILTNTEILKLSSAKPTAVYLDIGASEGSTSLQLIDMLGPAFSRFYVTDYNLSAEYERAGNRWRFFDHRSGECILAGNRFFALRPPAIAFFRRLGFFRATAEKKNRTKVSLINPCLNEKADGKDSRISIMEHDVRNTWPGDAPNVIKIANVLNRVYFSDRVIISALNSALDALVQGGLLVLMHNLNDRESAIFIRKVKSKSITIIKRIGVRLEIEPLLKELRYTLR